MSENFKHNIKVYYEDTDAGGVVYYANYLKFLERARTEAISSIGLSNKKIKDEYESLIIVKSCNIEYKKSAYLEDELTVSSSIKSFSKTSFLMNQIITKNDFLICTAETHLVIIDIKGKPKKIPDILIEKFKPYIKN
ncbi:YbgC/FadM family acyl-CoA thioesterase [Candidatus Pelagibacter sp.]|nr:YbgC/FadM family acyl-CoA thioesterase [Candidatus Pelagibacter sp.]